MGSHPPSNIYKPPLFVGSMMEFIMLFFWGGCINYIYIYYVRYGPLTGCNRDHQDDMTFLGFSRIGDPELNLHFRLASWEGATPNIYIYVNI